ncbi:MAG: sugar phosphate isomerase/epimerase [Clostridia bacterium]|nr:sugar phosphate isomerase/epimerase [Clostridia bacterium]
MAVFRLSAFADEADRSLEGQIAALKTNGVYQVELRGVDGKNVSLLSEEEAAEVCARLSSEGIKVSSIGSPYGKTGIRDDFEEHFELFKKGLKLTRLLGADRIRMFSFFMPKGEDPALYRDEVMRRLDKMAEAARAEEIMLVHENEKGIYGDTDDRCLDILKEFSGRILGVFDPANFIQCGVHTPEAMEKLKDHIVYMHIKDALLEDGSVVPAGYGDGHVKELLEVVSKRADSMTLTLEPHLKVFAGLSGLQGEEVKHRFVFNDNAEAFRASADALKAILKDLGFEESKRSCGTWIK